VLEFARELVALSRAGLRRQPVRDASGADESVLLAPLEAILERGTSLARHWVELWNGPWRQDISRLIEHARY
jgi:glutamate--cysteine ligase